MYVKIPRTNIFIHYSSGVYDDYENRRYKKTKFSKRVEPIFKEEINITKFGY